MATVRVKVFENPNNHEKFTVKSLSKATADRLVQVSPKLYEIVAPPTVDVTTLPPVEKKSENVVAKEVPSIGKDIPTKAVKAEPAETKQTTEQAIKKPTRQSRKKSKS